MGKCKYKRKTFKGYFCKCKRDGSLRKKYCYTSCPYFEHSFLYKLFNYIFKYYKE